MCLAGVRVAGGDSFEDLLVSGDYQSYRNLLGSIEVCRSPLNDEVVGLWLGENDVFVFAATG